MNLLNAAHHKAFVNSLIYRITTVPNEDGEVDWYVTSEALSGTAGTQVKAYAAACAALRNRGAR